MTTPAWIDELALEAASKVLPPDAVNRVQRVAKLQLAVVAEIERAIAAPGGDTGSRIPRPVTYPAAMNESMKFALGLPNFRCIEPAQRLRLAGFDIARKAEAEQAAVIHWLLPFAIEGGDDWLDRAQASLTEPKAPHV